MSAQLEYIQTHLSPHCSNLHKHLFSIWGSINKHQICLMGCDRLYDVCALTDVYSAAYLDGCVDELSDTPNSLCSDASKVCCRVGSLALGCCVQGYVIGHWISAADLDLYCYHKIQNDSALSILIQSPSCRDSPTNAPLPHCSFWLVGTHKVQNTSNEDDAKLQMTLGNQNTPCSIHGMFRRIHSSSVELE